MREEVQNGVTVNGERASTAKRGRQLYGSMRRGHRVVHHSQSAEVFKASISDN